jgi:hypothetical protein
LLLFFSGNGAPSTPTPHSATLGGVNLSCRFMSNHNSYYSSENYRCFGALRAHCYQSSTAIAVPGTQILVFFRSEIVLGLKNAKFLGCHSSNNCSVFGCYSNYHCAEQEVLTLAQETLTLAQP